MTSAPTQREIDGLLALFGAGRYAELEQAAQELLRHAPAAGFAWKALGVAQKLQGKDSLHAAREAARLLPGDAEAQLNLGAAQRDQGLLEEAVASYRQALDVNHSFVDAHSNLANVLGDLGRFDEAVLHCQQAIGLAPDHASAWVNLAYLLQRMGQTQGAIDAGRKAVALTPANASAHNNLANALRDAGNTGEAETHYRQALHLQPRHARAWLSLAALLTDTGRPAEAIVCCRKALDIEPRLAEAHNNLADACKEIQQFDAALAAYERALAINPGHAQTHYNLSLLLLTLGRYEEAWPHHEWRTDAQRGNLAVRPPALDSTLWRGESLARKHIVLCHEQGYGDTIQFIRYAPLLKRLGAARVSLVCPAPLAPLMTRATGVDQVFDAYEAVPRHDLHALTMSLPHYLGTRMDNIPARLPYLSPDPQRVRQWGHALPEQGIKIGLAWKGNERHRNDANRSLPQLDILAPLWQVQGVQFISVQKGRGEDEARAASPHQPLVALGHTIADFADLAAVISQLDLIVTVDTAIAHLAGALGKLCWVLLPAYGTDWRWLREREDSPWYPGTMRLFRQRQAGDWRPVVERLAAELELLAQTRR
ncbi:MAG: tetratricopeptide repeat protein [Burkholderiaceae bacterium]|nr:tetratricopeptide repeat protein [Burkholderiaceae bacterium]